MNMSTKSLAAIVLGLVLVAAVTHYLTVSIMEQHASEIGGHTASAEKQPLYWVAPMDPNYQRDKPGKSPMGMDLIPVYAEDTGGSDEGPGTIRISPEVVNNLGVRTAKAVRQPLRSMIRTVGYVQYDEDRLIHIHPRVQGWVEKLHVKASGDPVIKGQALYELYSPELVNAQEEFVLALNRSNERLVRAARDRLQALQLSTELVDELEKSRKVTQTITFYAPQAGVVDNLNIREGFFVQPGTMLMSIGALDDVWVQAEVFERQAMLVNVGMPVTMTLEYLPGREWKGQVDYVYPKLDEKTRTLRVRLRFDNSDGVLQPNMFTQVVLHADSDVDTLIVPREAVIRTGNQNRIVLALGEGRFKSVAVKLGSIDESSAEVIEGLTVGETVVTSAQFLLDSESSKTSDFQRMEAAESERPESPRMPSGGEHHHD
jgi:membrane fusion protein, copper/silver efflux system